MVYAGPNQPVAPIDDPYRMFAKLYGKIEDRESLKSVLDLVSKDLRKVCKLVSKDDRHVLEAHQAFVRQMEQELQADRQQTLDHDPPVQEPGVKDVNENMPRLSKMQIDLLVNALANDMARIATLQFTRSAVRIHGFERVDDSRRSVLDLDQRPGGFVSRLVLSPRFGNFGKHGYRGARLGAILG